MKFLYLSLVLSSLVFATDLQRGDVILLELDCYTCSLIAGETGGPYSHSGVVIQTNPKVVIAQALGSVHRVDLKYFMAMRKKSSKALVLRSLEKVSFKNIESIFLNDYEHASFDHDYLWSNESYYCSEMIVKLLNQFLESEIRPRPMSYLKYWDEWVRYFGGPPPQGRPGYNPNSFYLSHQFSQVGYL